MTKNLRIDVLKPSFMITAMLVSEHKIMTFYSIYAVMVYHFKTNLYPYYSN